MKQKIKILFIFQLILNVLLVSYVVYNKRTAIITRLNKIYSKETIVSKEQLSQMNRTIIPAFIDTCNNKSGEQFKILIIGNSLSYHGIAKESGWNHISGMAASKIEHDFAHLIFEKTGDLLPNKKIFLRISNLTEFERNYSTFDFAVIDSLVSYHPDLIVFQLGENVSFDEINTQQLFEKKYVDLINCFKKDNNPIVICTTPFFPSLEKNEIIKKIALTTKCFVADLSHLILLDNENYSKNENNYAGDRNIWKVDGIGLHPGDYGMRNIAQQVFIVINASVAENDINKK
jgi:hypothetical protein